MDFKINNIILWPRDSTKKIRNLEFKLDKINVITGDSQKGKSSIIQIIDYCLGSSKCTIPVGLIRDKTEWFGIVVSVEGKKILFARKEPGVHSQSVEAFIKEDVEIDNLPRPTAERNVTFLKNKLNEIAALPYLTLVDDVDENAAGKRASFRDFSAFQFQPQHIVANPYTLFYKADTYENRERLKNIFPLVLGALDKETLYLRQQLKELEQEYSKKSKELNEVKRTTEHWMYRVKSYYSQAKEYGLLPNAPDFMIGWSTQEYIRNLEGIPLSLNSEIFLIESQGTNSAVAELNLLLNEELELSREIGTLRQKLYKMSRLFESEKLYHESLEKQQERLQPTIWFRKLVEPRTTCIFCGSENSSAYEELERLYNYHTKINISSNDIVRSYDMLDREIVKIKKRLSELEKSLNIIRKQKNNLEVESDEIRKIRQTEQEVFRFVGRLEKALEDYKLVHEDYSLQDEVTELENKINILKEKINPQKIKANLKKALENISSKINRYADFLGVEDADHPISLDITNLTLRKISGKREDFLWEIGSGANWMGYHIATMLALHEYFIALDWNPVPQFLVIDQPSQVYFPEKIIEDTNENDGNEVKQAPQFKQEDVVRVQKIFTALSAHLSLKNTAKNYFTQIIVVEHADEITWIGSKKDIHVVARWRDGNDALIPEEWL
ncbi:hypothetical protein CPY53_07270 [Paenibacillus polymyxa]|uniref:DUF3732 domain-containing protein n=1 Tax=Paenibacillus polymyxa TaxID=1406 RepID=UPI001F57120E|nr:DUF3732 domain-containing protein [Paenibacillus polymyxa]UNL93386.1 hypothetical protein CPY53_07270 [Paenibacillus polymyxa]